MAASAAGRRPPRRRGAAATAALLAACTLLLLPGGARGLEYMRDETLWMKQRWAEWRLPFPWAAVKQRDAEATRQLQGPLAGFPLNSMNGPLLDGAALAAKAEEAAHKALGGGGGGSLELSLLDGEASQEVAAAVASCKVRAGRRAPAWAGLRAAQAVWDPNGLLQRLVAPFCRTPPTEMSNMHSARHSCTSQVCGSLTKQLWAGLTAWVDRRRLLPSHKAIAAYAAELCEYEVRAVQVLHTLWSVSCSDDCLPPSCASCEVRAACRVRAVHAACCGVCCVGPELAVSPPRCQPASAQPSSESLPRPDHSPSPPAPPPQVPNEVLGEWVLLRARVQPTPAAGLPFALDGQGAHEFYLLRWAGRWSREEVEERRC